MTEQPKEYIITDEQLQKISFDYVSNIRDPCTTVHDRAAYVDTIRSRPHTSAPAPYLPISLDFQPICIDKPCIGQIDICPVDDECDSVKQCVAHAEWLRQNPDVAERNRKIVAQHDAAIERKAREDVMRKLELRKTNIITFYSSQTGAMAEMGQIRLEEICGILESLRAQQAGDP